jgi:signal transduction histidine kinase
MWSGVFICLAGVAIGIPVLVMQLQGIPITRAPAVWWTSFVAYLVAMVVTSWLADSLPRRLVVAAFAAQAVLGPALVLLAPQAGWTPILLVFTAVTSTYYVGWRLTAAIIAANTVVVAIAGQQLADVMALGSWAFPSALLYLLLQVGSVFGELAHRREIETRRKLATAHTELRAATALLSESTRADERLRIARELHDLLGHQLTVLSLELEVATHHSQPPVREHVTRAASIAHELLTDVRATVGELRSRAPDLRETLDRIVADLPEPVTHLRIDHAVRADEGQTAAIVRCVQEVVTNTIRHADATELWIEIGATPDGGVTFTAYDDGRGADRVVPGNGLRGITERVQELGGSASFSPDRGFRVVAELPAR